MTPALLILGYGVLIVIVSLVGGWLPRVYRFSHTQMQVILSFVGGLMLGIGLLHLLPHAVAQSRSLDMPLASALGGLLFMFFLIRLFHFHQHATADEPEDAHGDCDHDHSHQHHHEFGNAHALSWAGVATGLAIHTLIDGLALGAAVVCDAQSRAASMPWGLGVFVAIACHKPLDALSITTLMQAGGWTVAAQRSVNLAFSLLCPLGAGCFLLGFAGTAADVQPGRVASPWLGAALGFSAGTFLCISLSDLLPEVQFHRHDRWKLSTALLLGVVMAYGIGWLEHPEGHKLPPPPEQRQTDG